MKMYVKMMVCLITMTAFFGCSNDKLLTDLETNSSTSRNITVPTGPKDLLETLKRPTALGLKWDAVDNTIGYKIYYISKIIDSAKLQVIDCESNSYEVKGLLYGDILDFYVTAIDISGLESLPSKRITVTMDCKLKTPEGLAEIGKTHNSIRLKWAVNGDPVGKYYVHLRSANHNTTVSVYTNYVEVIGLSQDTEYYIYIESCSGDIYRSEYSEGIVVKTLSVYDQWESDKVYWKGDKVRYNGRDYVAKWWSYNDVPGAVQYGPWESEK